MGYHLEDFDHLINMGPVSGLSGVARELMRHLGYEPDDYPAIARELESLIGDELLDIGREVLAAHGLAVRDSAGITANAGRG